MKKLIPIHLLKAVKAIDKQIVISYNLNTLERKTKDSELCKVPDSFKAMLPETY